MKKNRTAQIITFVVLLAALGVATTRTTGRRIPDLWRSRAGAPPESSANPPDVIYAMLNAAREGDVKAYLASHTGPIEAALRQTLAETGESSFAQYLRNSNASLKGVAVGDPQAVTNQETKVRVEYVYQDRNEVQWMYLEKGPNGWRISRTDGAEPQKALVPYGTPVR